jgi:hypothetical protein
MHNNKCAVLTENFEILLLKKSGFNARLLVELNEGFSVLVSIVGFWGLVFLLLRK